MTTEKEILDKLSEVVDPELGINIVDLGLIYEIKMGKTIVIRMTFTTPACPMINEMLNDIKAKLDEAFGELDIELVVVFDPLWTPERLSEKAKIKLGLV
ncbi:metal-sulfur cluster assembly factor [Candidatus Micrarchaeota archaeon]|nr:metal-sulfur cluster assembly factor [Candidatus Micrarchaeota archaeon]